MQTTPGSSAALASTVARFSPALPEVAGFRPATRAWRSVLEAPRHLSRVTVTASSDACEDEEPIAESLVAGMRLVLAACALVIIAIDPSEPDRLVAITYAVLGLYTAYSAAVYWAPHPHHPRITALLRFGHWADVGWYTVLVALSNGTNSLFFSGYLFATLVAAFRYGWSAGIRVSTASAALFAIVSYTVGPSAASFELNRLLLRALFLLVLGYLMSSFGGYEVALRARLRLLRDVSVIANPRFGVHYTFARILERVRQFHRAEQCVIVLREGNGATVRRADQSRPDAGAEAVTIPDALAGVLLAIPDHVGCVLKSTRGQPRRAVPHLLRDTRGAAPAHVSPDTATAVVDALDASTIVTVPIVRNEEVIGRCYVCSPRIRPGGGDIDLLSQVLQQVMPVIDNIRLVDRLASEAADCERRRIARDIHDSVIQSYIGLQLALDAVERRSRAGLPVTTEIGTLVEHLAREISDARRFVSSLEGGSISANAFVDSLQRFSAKFQEATDIAVDLQLAPTLTVSDRLAAELFSLAAEGLSNVRRHTTARQATVRVGASNSSLAIEIENPAPATVADFVPKSISRRARALGGRTVVHTDVPGKTVVAVHIPL